MSEKMNYGFGWLKDQHDHRDYHVGVNAQFRKLVALPDSFELPQFKSLPVKNQGQTGACVGFSTSVAKAYADMLERAAVQVLSAGMIYAEGRKMEGSYPQDAGMWIRDAMKLLADKGVPQDKLWPWSATDFNQLYETAEMWTDAALQKVKSYARLTTVSDIKQALVQGSPILIGVPVYDSWPMVTVTGHVPTPKPGEKVRGGHAIVLYGYALGELKFRNSWSSLWGAGGNGTFEEPWIQQILANGNADAWSYVDIVLSPTPPNPPPPQPPGPRGLTKFRVAVNRGNSWVVVSEFQA